MPVFRKKPEEWQSKLGTSTFDPLQVQDMQDAISHHLTTVSVGGRKFLLTYYTTSDGDKVYYRPADDSFAPAGHLDIKKFLEV